MTRRTRCSVGFTLMEVLVASVLISTVFVAVVSVMSQSLRNIDRMRPHETAMLHAREKMNDALLREQLGFEHGTGRWDDGYRWQLDIAPYQLIQAQQQQVGQPGLFKIRVQIVWGEAQAPRTYAVETTQWANRLPEKQQTP